ncbi:MAG TPA: FCD domain-containing protein [Symbiobacteriaceae bacterium]|nr:FCD domain-containing protein [Symbiobacteriaceae bacterium]
MLQEVELEFLVLGYLARTDGPVGSGVICDWLRHEGHDISEATVGRFLRELDVQNYTERAGFRGRTLTDKGEARLAQLRHQQALSQSSGDLMKALQGGSLDHVVEVLVARRGLEREIARLAAMCASDRDIEALELLINRYEVVGDLGASAEADFAFHARLAEISGNKVLQAATQLIHAEAQGSMIPEPIRHKLKPELSRQHAAILDAIRTHDPDSAEGAMLQHLDLLITAVQQYGQEPVME